MGKRGPRKRTRDAAGIPVAPLPSGVTAGQLVPPEHVADDPLALSVWEWLVGTLAARGDLRESHKLALGLLAGEWSRHVTAARIARKNPIVEGPRGVKAHPAAGVAAAAARVVRDLLGDFGLTPAALSRLDVPASSPDMGTSPIDAILKRKAALDAKVAADDDDLDDLERFRLTHGDAAEKAAVVAGVLGKRRRGV